MEKRNGNRHRANHSIVCTLFTSHACEDTFDGWMENYCESGIYAELPTQFKEGTVLIVRTTSGPNTSPPCNTEEGCRSISLMEVKWSKPLSGYGSVRYGTGFRHLSVQ
jgi:hypothetical protein